jgi:hypothetical protein
MNMVILPEKPLPAKANFWKVNQITNKEMINTAETGDILLFTGY